MANVVESSGEWDDVTGPEEPRDLRATARHLDEKDNHPMPPMDGVAMKEKPVRKKNTKLEVSQSQVLTAVDNLCPKVNCCEKILLCLDFSQEMHETYFRSRAGDKMSSFRETVKALRMFVMNKQKINPKHEFALALYDEQPCWVHDFCKPKEMLVLFDKLLNQDPVPAADLDLTKVFELLCDNIELPEVVGDVRVAPPPYTVRVVFVYGRSQCVPKLTDKRVHLKLESSPYFFFDVLYVHEPPSEDNKCEEIFAGLCDLDRKGLSYILEAASLTQLFNCAAMLLAHPLQRPLQRQAEYQIATTPAD